MNTLVASFALPFIYKMLYVENKILREPPMGDFAKIQCAARYDYIDWQPIKMYLGTVFLLFPRVLSFIVTCIIGSVYHNIHVKLFSEGKILAEQSLFYHYLPCFWKCFLFRPLRFFMGYTSYQIKSHKISDYIADYQKYEKKANEVQAPISICNHNAGGDIFLLIDYFPYLSFLAKIGISKLSCIGSICTSLQSLYINRSGTDDGKNIVEDIQQRVDDIQSGKNFPSLLIFPECATNVGHSLMKFKRGAFINNCPIRILFMEYGYDGINPCMVHYNEFEFLILTMSSWGMSLTVHEFDNFDIKYTLDKYNLKEVNETNWEYLEKDVAYLYEHAFGVRYTDNTMRSRIELELKHGIDMRYEKKSVEEKEVTIAGFI